jgi:hypothetical protein
MMFFDGNKLKKIADGNRNKIMKHIKEALPMNLESESGVYEIGPLSVTVSCKMHKDERPLFIVKLTKTTTTDECGVETIVVNSNGQKVNSKSLKKKIKTIFLRVKKSRKEWMPSKVGNVFTKHGHIFECQKKENRSQWMVSKAECGDETIVVYPNGEELNSTSSQKLKKLFDKWIPSNVGKSYTKNGFEFECKMEGNRSQWIFSTVECGVKTIVVNPNGKQIKSKKNLNKIQKLFRSVKESMPSKVGNGFTKDGYKFECQKEGYETQWMVSKAKDENDESRRLQLADDADV